MTVDYFKKSMKLALKETFSSIKYGDNHRIPFVYTPTHTQYFLFRGTLPEEFSMHSKQFYQEFPKLSYELLVTLFSKIGVDHVPEICVYELKEKRPLEIFRDFVLSFGIRMDDRLEQRAIIDATLLNRVILFLIKMDDARREKLFDSKPIYKLLAQHEFDKANRMMDKLRK